MNGKPNPTMYAKYNIFREALTYRFYCSFVLSHPVKKVRMAALVHRYIGIDVGSQKTMMIAEDAEIILTDTGSVSFPTLFSCSETKYNSSLKILKEYKQL